MVGREIDSRTIQSLELIAALVISASRTASLDHNHAAIMSLNSGYF